MNMWERSNGLSELLGVQRLMVRRWNQYCDYFLRIKDMFGQHLIKKSHRWESTFKIRKQFSIRCCSTCSGFWEWSTGPSYETLRCPSGQRVRCNIFFCYYKSARTNKSSFNSTWETFLCYAKSEILILTLFIPTRKLFLNSCTYYYICDGATVGF